MSPQILSLRYLTERLEDLAMPDAESLVPVEAETSGLATGLVAS